MLPSWRYFPKLKRSTPIRPLLITNTGSSERPDSVERIAINDQQVRFETRLDHANPFLQRHASRQNIPSMPTQYVGI